MPLSALVAEEVADATSAIEPERFFPQGRAWEGHWKVAPLRFPTPDTALERRELRALLLFTAAEALDAAAMKRRAG